ncbi:UNVERIFIED_CONTAM: hypothetical protein HHA_288370 [Hammondia hammondi]|eukprot:XP_008889029.1 hypothetical protein HHA_288370 [Hammondia hammondi]
MASLRLSPLPSTRSSRDTQQSEEGHFSQDRSGVRVALTNVSPAASCPGLLSLHTPGTEDALRDLSVRLLREAEGLFSSLFRQQVSRSPAWIASELLLLRRLLYKFKRQHSRAEFFQKAQTVSRVAQPLLSLLSLFSPEGLRAPSLGTHELLSSLLSRVHATSARRGGAGDALPNTSPRDGQQAEANAGAAHAGARASGREGDRSGRSLHGVAKTLLSFFLEALLARALHVQDATVHASSSAIQQVHLGYHLNLVLPLLAIYSRLLALVSALVGAAEHQVQHVPLLLDFLGKVREDAERRKELREKSDAKRQRSTQRVACPWDAPPTPAGSGVHTPHAPSREEPEAASHRETSGDGGEKGRERVQEEAAQEARRAGDDGGEEKKDVSGSDAQPVGEEAGREPDTAAAFGETERAAKRQRTGETERVFRSSSDATTGVLSAHDASSEKAARQARDDMLAFLLSERKKPTPFASLPEKKNSGSSAKKKRTASGAMRPLHSDKSTTAVLAAGKCVKKKLQSESSYPQRRERSEAGISTADHDALLSFLLSEKHPKRRRPLSENPKALATTKSEEKRKVPPSAAQTNSAALPGEKFSTTGGLKGVAVSSRGGNPASSCVSNQHQPVTACPHPATVEAGESLPSHLAYRRDKVMKSTASEVGRQTGVAAPPATTHKKHPKGSSANRSPLPACTPEELRVKNVTFPVGRDSAVSLPLVDVESLSLEKPRKKKKH